MTGQTIWYQVADLNNPSAEPFMVLRVDTSVRRGTGVEAEVVSLHWTRDRCGSASSRALAVLSRQGADL